VKEEAGSKSCVGPSVRGVDSETEWSSAIRSASMESRSDVSGPGRQK
jgi:hypothetical protein